MMTQVELQNLIEKYQNGKCSAEEICLLESWYLSEAKTINTIHPTADTLDFYKKAIWAGVTAKKQSGRRRFINIAAASVLLTLSVCAYLLINRNVSDTVARQIAFKNDFKPASNQAIFISPKGERINLRDTSLVSFRRLLKSDKDSQQGYNTIKTPDGGQWPAIELPDGTKVFLDAASSITFPVAFEKERKVTITGQVFFEVKHDDEIPFLIQVKGVTIEDLGTTFNVNAYDDESLIQTTLIEGSVSVAKPGHKTVLKPGQQAVTPQGKGSIITREADLEEVMAWKNGLFHFNHTPIREVMHQLSRWYNVNIVYKNDVSGVSFTGNVPKNLKASRLLEILSITGLEFSIDENAIVVGTLNK